ncbi:MAG TPA: p-hydroxycinnamoyl CoA hydratase/lyase [Stellaceae bacterium]|jgi:trans-feruloyl-CoA hydratase/vanillin synthase|nr:p-hydroxycinnamoyl CoA hydratase/lyase [Stellaceae bacterium]
MAEQLGGKTVLVEFDEGIAWVTLNRPEKRNAMNPALNHEMTEVLEALEVDDRCGVLVLTGAGDAFTAGMDLKEFFRESDRLPPEAWGQIARQAQIWQMQRLKWFPKPTIAMVNGWCFGGGFNPVISCDIALAAEDATFGLSEVNWGIIPAGNVLRSIALKLRDTDGLYYALTGDTFTGKEAAAMGLVKFAVPRAELKPKTRELAVKLLGKNRAAIRAIKHAYRKMSEMSWDASEDYLMAKLDQLRLTDPEKGRAQGMKQFLDEKAYRPGLGNYERKE